MFLLSCSLFTVLSANNCILQTIVRIGLGIPVPTSFFDNNCIAEFSVNTNVVNIFPVYSDQSDTLNMMFLHRYSNFRDLRCRDIYK